MAEVKIHQRNSPARGGIRSGVRQWPLLCALCWIVLWSWLSSPVRAQEISESYRNALVAYKSGQFDVAATEVEKSVTESPQEARPYLLRGRIRTALKQYAEAEKDLRSALKLDRSSNLGYFYLGELFFAQRNFAVARVNYAMYHHYVPDDADTTLKLVYCALGDLNPGEAQRLADSLNLFDEKNPSAYFAKAAIARMTEQAKPETAHAESAKLKSDNLLQQAEMIYGHTLYTSYLSDYLLLVSPPDKSTP